VERQVERDPNIDALRGLCLLGIAIVNTPWIGMERPLFAYLFDPELRAQTSMIDLGAAGLIEWLAEGKFYPQFSMLFGFGAGVMLAKGTMPYARRIAVLTIFGLLHSAFGWYGDILLDYAIVGVLLIAIVRLPARVILGLSIATFAAACVLSYFFDGWNESEQAWGESVAYGDHLREIYAHGTFAEITAERWRVAVLEFPAWEYSYRANTLAMVCFGLWVFRRGLPAARPLGLAALVLCPLGLALAFVPYTYIPAGDVCAVGYACAFLWVARKGRALVALLAPLGRCAISGYLGQTLVLTLVFYSYGLGWFGELGPLACLGLAASVWALEVVLAWLWMRWFSLGPVEWLWRAATYLRWPSMRRDGNLRA
jgi:uncharacterized protein